MHKVLGCLNINFHNVCNEYPIIWILYVNVHFLIALNFNLGTAMVREHYICCDTDDHDKWVPVTTASSTGYR
jgi:hypothetical protein